MPLDDFNDNRNSIKDLCRTVYEDYFDEATSLGAGLLGSTALFSIPATIEDRHLRKSERLASKIKDSLENFSADLNTLKDHLPQRASSTEITILPGKEQVGFSKALINNAGSMAFADEIIEPVRHVSSGGSTVVSLWGEVAAGNAGHTRANAGSYNWQIDPIRTGVSNYLAGESKPLAAVSRLITNGYALNFSVLAELPEIAVPKLQMSTDRTNAVKWVSEKPDIQMLRDLGFNIREQSGFSRTFETISKLPYAQLSILPVGLALGAAFYGGKKLFYNSDENQIGTTRKLYTDRLPQS